MAEKALSTIIIVTDMIKTNVKKANTLIDMQYVSSSPQTF